MKVLKSFTIDIEVLNRWTKLIQNRKHSETVENMMRKYIKEKE